jgi:hypothetical protein
MTRFKAIPMQPGNVLCDITFKDKRYTDIFTRSPGTDLINQLLPLRCDAFPGGE